MERSMKLKTKIVLGCIAAIAACAVLNPSPPHPVHQPTMAEINHVNQLSRETGLSPEGVQIWLQSEGR
jgi:hypothetical protein